MRHTHSSNQKKECQLQKWSSNVYITFLTWVPSSDVCNTQNYVLDVVLFGNEIWKSTTKQLYQTLKQSITVRYDVLIQIKPMKVQTTANILSTQHNEIQIVLLFIVKQSSKVQITDMF